MRNRSKEKHHNFNWITGCNEFFFLFSVCLRSNAAFRFVKTATLTHSLDIYAFEATTKSAPCTFADNCMQLNQKVPFTNEHNQPVYTICKTNLLHFNQMHHLNEYIYVMYVSSHFVVHLFWYAHLLCTPLIHWVFSGFDLKNRSYYDKMVHIFFFISLWFSCASVCVCVDLHNRILFHFISIRFLFFFILKTIQKKKKNPKKKKNNTKNGTTNLRYFSAIVMFSVLFYTHHYLNHTMLLNMNVTMRRRG